MSIATTFAVCSFKRVYDTQPLNEVLSLAELVDCFRRFELKNELHAKIERELQRIDQALHRALRGETVGERVSAIASAGVEAGVAGTSAERAMRAKADELRTLAKKDAKKDLRLWSPSLYRSGVNERGADGVSHVSCLVLDYDSGVLPQQATVPFGAFFHLVHSTWSHSLEHPKFRVILPLAIAVPKEKWEYLWKWAEAETGAKLIEP